MSAFLGMMIGIVFGILIGTIPDGESVQLKEENDAMRELCIRLRGLTDEQIDALLTGESDGQTNVTV